MAADGVQIPVWSGGQQWLVSWHRRRSRIIAQVAAVLAGAVCALVLPHLIGSALDLSGFTGTAIPVRSSPT